MRKRTKVFLLALCAVLLVCASVFGTLAYLTAQTGVTNTFTFGNVTISMTETNILDPDGDRVTANTYEDVVPGVKLTKDPVIYVGATSVDCYVFLKVENGLKGLEAAGATIDDQLKANGWKELAGETGVYYLEAPQEANAVIKTFENVTIKTDATVPTGAVTVNVTAYAVQESGMADAADAWEKAGF